MKGVNEMPKQSYTLYVRLGLTASVKTTVESNSLRNAEALAVKKIKDRGFSPVSGEVSVFDPKDRTNSLSKLERSLKGMDVTSMSQDSIDWMTDILGLHPKELDSTKG
jgi:hypothetical protein